MEEPEGREEVCSRSGLLLVCTSPLRALVTMGYWVVRQAPCGRHPHTPSGPGQGSRSKPGDEASGTRRGTASVQKRPAFVPG